LRARPTRGPFDVKTKVDARPARELLTKGCPPSAGAFRCQAADPTYRVARPCVHADGGVPAEAGWG